jgi:large subunit ribosomal protein L4
VKLPVRDANGKELKALEVDDTVFGIEPNAAVLHQAFVAQRNNQRWGTAQTKTRSMVQGSSRKIRRQKYTGAARAGTNRAPTRVGGGTAFGPVQRDYSQALNKKMRRLAIRSALSGKVADGELVVIDQLAIDIPKTKQIIRVLRNVGIERSALIVTGQPERAVVTSARNLQKTKVLPAAYLNVVDMLNHRSLLMTEEAVRVAEGLWGRKKAQPAAAVEAAPKARRAAKAPVAEIAPALKAEAPVEAPAPKARASRATAVAKKAAVDELEIVAKLKAAAKPKSTAKAKATAKPKATTKAKAAAKPKATTEAKAVAKPTVAAKSKPAVKKPAAKPDAEPAKPRPKRARKTEGEDR